MTMEEWWMNGSTNGFSYGYCNDYVSKIAAIIFSTEAINCKGTTWSTLAATAVPAIYATAVVDLL